MDGLDHWCYQRPADISFPVNKLRTISTTNQLIRDGRKEKQRTDRTRALNKCPQKEGVCLRVLTRTPKKPNSALRKIAKVHLTNKHAIFAYIPGEGHNLQEHSKGGGRVKDSPGAKLIGAGAATIALAEAAIGMENIFSSFIHSNATLPKEVFWVALFLNSLWLVYKFVPTRKGSEVEEQLLLLVVGWLYWIMLSSFLSIEFSLLLISMNFGSSPTSQEIHFLSMMEGAGNGSGSSGLASSGEEGVSSDGSLTAFRQTINLESEQNLFRRIQRQKISTEQPTALCCVL